jgi:hypothetical protein
MQRRQFTHAATLGALFGLAAMERANALTLDNLSNADAAQGLKTALEKGALSAIAQLGATDGFLGNDKVRINLPGSLQDAVNLLRTLGQGGRVDELITAMNRGAEAAMPMAKDLLVNTVHTMNVTDAKGILTGGDTAVTQFFAGKTRSTLVVKFLPVVSRATEKVGLTQK